MVRNKRVAIWRESVTIVIFMHARRFIQQPVGVMFIINNSNDCRLQRRGEWNVFYNLPALCCFVLALCHVTYPETNSNVSSIGVPRVGTVFRLLSK